MMGKGKSKRNGFVVASDKGAGERECCDIDIGLGLVMETHQSFPCKEMDQMHHHHHEAQFCSNGGFHGETASNSEPVFYNTRNNNNCPVTANIYNAVCSDFGSGVPKNLQQPNHSTDSLSFSYSGGMVNIVNVRIPFTPAQREELETQTLVYKYILACLPVPQQLLLSMTKNPPNGVKGSLRSENKGGYPTKGVRDVLGLGVSRNLDPEPWRCKRTDGKKWRCSRDIANDQKYCERHCHKRRSRKPVESNPNFIINNINMPSPQPSFCKNNNHQTPFPRTMVTPAAAAVTSHGQSRTMDWFMNGESASVAGSNREWEQLMPFKLGLKSHHTKRDKDLDFAKQQNENLFNLCRGDSHGLQRQRQISHDHLGGALNSYQAQETRHFIDAWSTERAGINDLGKSCSVPLNQKLPFSSLTLSISENETSEESVNAQKGLEVLASERENAGDMKSQWMNSLSWMSSTPPGGPLGEALCLRMASST